MGGAIVPGPSLTRLTLGLPNVVPPPKMPNFGMTYYLILISQILPAGGIFFLILGLQPRSLRRIFSKFLAVAGDDRAFGNWINGVVERADKATGFAHQQ